MAIGFHISKPLASTSNAVIELSGIEKPSAVQCLFGGERKLLRAFGRQGDPLVKSKHAVESLMNRCAVCCLNTADDQLKSVSSFRSQANSSSS